MIPEVLLDTDILSEVFKGRDVNVNRRKSTYAKSHRVLTFTSVTVMEILRGLHHKTALTQIARAESIFAQNREIVPDRNDYRLAAEIIGALTRRGTPIGVSDPLIAACAIGRDLTLATGNVRHFGFVQAAGFALRIEDWRSP